MNYIGKFISNFKDFYNEINAATLTGAIDVIIVRQEDGSYLCSPFHVRFGKIGVLRSREKVVDIEVNGEPVDIHMKLGDTGEAFFIEELEDGDEVGSLLGTSPLPPSVLHRTQDDDCRSQDSGVEAEGLLGNAFKQQSHALTRHDYVQECGQATLGYAYFSSSNLSDGLGEMATMDTAHGKISQGTQTEPAKLLASHDDGPYRNTDGSLKQSRHLSRSLNGDSASQLLTSVSADLQGSKTDGEEIVKSTKSIRRKRKKKYTGKKQRSNTSGSQSSDASTTSEVADVSSVFDSAIASNVMEDAIFDMDDIETGMEAAEDTQHITGIAQSTSAPQLGEKLRDGSTKNWKESMSCSMGPDYHPFSDTDISPPTSPKGSRPPTPIKSDTEYEVERQKSECADGSSQTDSNKWSWTWGELPTPPPKTPGSRSSPASKSDPSTGSQEEGEDKASKVQEEEEHRSMLGSMFSFMRATKKARHNPEGIYLADLNLEELDPEVAALYFPRNSRETDRTAYAGLHQGVTPKDEDVESGNGPSLPHSPHSVEGAIGGPKMMSSDSDFEDSRHPIFFYRGYDDVAFSVCGRLHEYIDAPFPESLFLQSLVTYDDFCEDPRILDNPDLIIRLGGKYMNWATAAPQILSLVLFQRPMPQKLVNDLEKEHMPKKEIRKRTESKGLSWFLWRHNTQAEENSAGSTKTESTHEATPDSVASKGSSPEPVCDTPKPAAPVEIATTQTQTSLPGTPDKRWEDNHSHRADTSESEDLEEEKAQQTIPRVERYRKTLRLSVEQIGKLNLRDGSNEVVFSVTTAYQGTTRCKCHIFLWNYDEKIVVSDIDGTITKSDVLGHILPIIGKDWAQSGVAQLFTKIKNNGYHFLYLSARAIGQARITRDYLRSVRQGDLSLPDGPLLLNPTSLVQAFHREVIERKPEEFKISCLRDIQALFPSDRNPFYAGYGNRVNDVWAYRAVGIPISRIFTINHRGELKHELTQTFQSSYINLSDIAHHMFPPRCARDLLGEFSSLQFWRVPLPDVGAEIESVLAALY